MGAGVQIGLDFGVCFKLGLCFNLLQPYFSVQLKKSVFCSFEVDWGVPFVEFSLIQTVTDLRNVSAPGSLAGFVCHECFVCQPVWFHCYKTIVEAQTFNVSPYYGGT